MTREEIKVGDIIPIHEENGRYDWMVRCKDWHEESEQHIYFMTRPGFEGWYTREFLLAVMDKEAEA